MNKYKILHWDDDPDYAVDMEFLLQKFFYADDYEYEFSSAPIEEFEKKLFGDNPAHFDLLILDLLDETQSKTPAGIKILKRLDKDKKVFIITQAATEYINKELKDGMIKVSPTIQTKVLDKDDYMPIIQELTGLKKKPEHELNINWDEKNITANYQVSLLTKDHLNELILAHLNAKNIKAADTTSVVVKPLVSGYSGALVFQVTIATKSGISDLLLKADRIKSNLKTELEYSQSPYHYEKIPEHYTIRYAENILTSTASTPHWFALTARFIKDGQTLKKTIISGSSENVKALLQDLFAQCLTSMYSDTEKQYDNSERIFRLKEVLAVLNERKKAFILNTAEELKHLLPEKNGDAVEIIKNIFKYADDETAIDIRENKSYNKTVLVHGDLHGNNIMVSKNNQLKIIDPANMKPDHWTRDICMLAVDLFAYGLDADNKEYFGINNIEEWRKKGMKMFKGGKIAEDQTPLYDALNILSNHETIKKELGFDKWFDIEEFQLALIIEFLRVSYKSNQLPPGKRAACLLIAMDGFNLLKNGKNTGSKKSKR